MKKKSQIKFGETFGIIIIVWFIVMAGLIWYNNSNNKSIQKLEQENFLNSAYTTYNFLINLDLIKTSLAGNLKPTYDYHGILTLQKLLKEDKVPDIKNQLLNSDIQIHLFEKKPNEENLTFIKNITLINDIDQETPSRLTQTFKLLIPVENTVNKKTYIGIITLRISRR